MKLPSLGHSIQYIPISFLFLSNRICLLFSDYGDYGDYGNFAETSASGCENCPTRGKSRPGSDSFMKQLNWFLSDVPGTACPKAGKAAYSEAVR